ncbi:MAG: preprotein translocase subunit SecY [Candidatus Cloacimonadota bacterium]|nr:MAG: preprotein translocase subunit SecY [Candidatus Cloacimonadota bacterium]
MLEKLLNIFKIPDLRRKLLFTLCMFVVYRIGGHITLPGIDANMLLQQFQQLKGTLLGLYDIFSGGNLSRATIFALGIMPYISTSIILQLLGAVIPYYQRLQKEGEEGRRKITQHTRYGTVILATIQGFGISIFLENLGPGVVVNPGISFRLISVLTMVSGTIFIMWLGEQITEKGIGNGISLIIMIGIVARYPNDAITSWRLLKSGIHGPFFYIVLLIFVVLITAAVVFITQGQRRIPVQYARRVVGRKIYGGQSTFIPLNVNSAGVIPIIFAQSVIMLPTTLVQFFPKTGWVENIMAYIQPGYWLYNIMYGVLIVVFAYFYTAIVINPTDLADNMKKYGGFIPGKRPGAKTSEYIDRIITRITLPGAIFFAIVAILPMYLIVHFKVPFYFGGTSLLITVGVLLDTVQQIEAQLMMRHYEGFLKKGKIRGRRR